MSYLISYIVLAIIWGVLCYKFGDWKNWKLYYPTILYYIIADLTCHILTYNKPLWTLHVSYFNDTFSEYFLSFIVFPCIIILFLSNYPKKIIKQIIYIAIFVFILSLLEYVALITRAIIYENGWNSLWTILFYIIMFPLLRLHYKKPLLTWPISIILAFILLFFSKSHLKISDKLTIIL